MTDFNNNTPFGQAPQAQGFGAAPQGFGQQPAPQGQAQGFGTVPQGQPSFGAAPQGTPSFGGGTPAQAGGNTRKWESVTALELGWLTPEEAASAESYENDFNRISMEIENRFDLQVEGEVTFSALASPFLPKVDRKNNGHLWELSISIKNPRLVGNVHPFAKYAFAKRLSRNTETGEVSYRFTNEIRDTNPNMSRDQVKQVAMALTTKAGKPAPAWPIALIDRNDFSRQGQLTEKDFASDGSQTVILALQLVRTQNLASVAKYVWYKPYLQVVLADLDNIHWNEFNGSQFRAAQEHALEQARLAMQRGAQSEAEGFAPESTGFGQQAVPQGQPNFGAPQGQQAPQGQPNFGMNQGFDQAPNQMPQAPQGQPQGFGNAPQGFGAPQGQQAPQAPQGQPTGTPFAPPFDAGANNPFM